MFKPFMLRWLQEIVVAHWDSCIISLTAISSNFRIQCKVNIKEYITYTLKYSHRSCLSKNLFYGAKEEGKLLLIVVIHN